ncbi:hypothetical protein B0T16DRAFT_458224 [Cercophora newfieldiana]|uniref:Serine/threonine-protein kinase Tel1 n=1 Tax=Cercophora newfieldiana TaxID=92897 RepID=A0AA39Y5A0_9PEZI|nr:hypothetical protein B0T16DRAFT_458224 [Cercophora newfieldiana]
MPPRPRVFRGDSTNFREIAGLLISSSATTRKEAIDGLLSFFKNADESTQSQKQGLFDDKIYHSILESLFQCTLFEKEAYFNTKKSSKASTTASIIRLEKCAEALRLTVRHGAHKIKRKTARALIDHITQVLPGPEDSYIGPLLKDYVRALTAFLGVGSNVESLATMSGEGWVAAADFCIDALSLYLEGDGDSGPGSRASPAPGINAGRTKSVAISQSTNQIGSQMAVDFLLCLSFLVSATNSPVSTRADKIYQIALQILQLRQMKIGELQKAAFSTITSIIQRTQTEDVALTKKITRSLVPLLSYWWQPRTLSRDAMLNSVRDEMLKTISVTHLYLEALLREPSEESLLQDTEDLLDALWSEYSRREEKARLQLDDISFTTIRLPADHPRTAAFSLRPFNQAAEQNWAFLENLAILESIYSRSCRGDHGQAQPDVDQPRKKRRMASSPNRLHQKMLSVDTAVQLTALQVVPFLVKLGQLSLDDVTEMLNDVARCTPTKPGTATSWGMLAYSSIAAHKSSQDKSLAPFWKQIWQRGVRSLSLPSVSRAACALLESMLKADLVAKHELTDDLTLMVTTADISGPGVLVDSSLALMPSLLRLRNLLFPNASQATANYIIRWVFLKWKPMDTQYASTYAMHATAFDIVSLLRACYGMSPLSMAAPLRLFGASLAQFWKSQQDVQRTVRYLLLLPDEVPPVFFSSASLDENKPAQQTLDSESTEAHAAKRLILELFFPKIEELLQMVGAWHKRGADNPLPVSMDRLQSVISTCLAGLLMVPDFASLKSQTSEDFATQLNSVTDAALKVVPESPQSESFLNLILTLCSAHLPPLITEEVKALRQQHSPLLKFFSKVSSLLQEIDRVEGSSNHPDSMDIDDNSDSQSSHKNSVSKIKALPRRDIWLCHTPEAFYLETSLRIRYLDVIHGDEGAIGMVYGTFISRITQLTNQQFLHCRVFMEELFEFVEINGWEAAEDILEKLGGVIGASAFQCCEVALCTCIDVLASLGHCWSGKFAMGGRVPSLGGDFYQYFVARSLPNNSMSATTQISLSRLLFRLCEIAPDYAASLKLPSSRTTLLTILQERPIEVKFAIGLALPNLFGLYILKTHDDLFVDVLERLPVDPQNHEGIAFRLFALAEMACRWPTLLRRCIYHIFEIPGKIAESSTSKYAARCLQRIATSLKLTSPKELFSLFAPQVLYTWLDGDSLNNIPFAIFGFSSLQDLLSEAQTEASAILIMRGQERDALDLAKTLGISPEELVQRAFTKIMAYSIAHDISVASGDGYVTGEARVRKLLGKEKFLENIHLNFVDIIATFFNIFDQEDPIENAFARDEKFAYAATIMAQIKEYGHLPTALPPNQQPMFKAKYLQREIVHLCSRTPYEAENLWTPPLIVFVARKLLNTIHPALGPLHACSVLRKIRVLICLAGDRALASYPLEMLLYSIREFVLDPESADDALGIAKYLVLKGEAHLMKAPSFFAGYALSSLVDIRVFICSSQSSTTQESQFRATKTKAEEFHDWLRKHLLQYVSPAFKDVDQKRAFQAIMKSAAMNFARGSAKKGREESSLLLEILKDWGREHQLLGDPARKVALSMLNSEFQEPPPVREDIIETDDDAVKHAAVVWESCRFMKLSPQYLAWAGRVLGRAFAASGEVPQELLRESRLEEYRKLAPGKSGSAESLLSLLKVLTTSSDRFHAGLAESALRVIVTETFIEEDADLMYACGKSLPDSLQNSSMWEPYHTPQSDLFEVPAPLESEVYGVKQLESPKWAQNLTTLLAQSAPDVPTLRVLPAILSGVKGFAENALPFVVHLLLHYQEGQGAKRRLSEAIAEWLTSTSPAAKENLKLLLNTILYLRTQKLANETSIADRSHWLDVNFSSAAGAATRCGMYKVALLFAELAFSEAARSSRRSSAARDTEDSNGVLLEIFENIDDPDAYYGLEQDSSLSSVLSRLEYEKDGTKSLAFRGAAYDIHLRSKGPASANDAQALIKSLSSLGLAGLSNSLLQAQQHLDGSSASLDSTFTTARRLEKWNLPAPENSGSWAATVYKAYQGLHQATDVHVGRIPVYEGFVNTVRHMTGRSLNTSSLRQQYAALAALTELDDLINVSDSQDLKNILKVFEDRTKWMMSGRYDDVSQVLSCRETSLSSWSGNFKLRPPELEFSHARLTQIRALLLSCNVYRFHHANQETLNLSTLLTSLIRPSELLGLHGVDAAIKMEAANALWDQGEMVSSIRMLQGINKDWSIKKQMLPVNRSHLLSKIGHQVSVARLESPDKIQKTYLEPALKELGSRIEGTDAGRVFHQFAMFCDEQLQNADNQEDLARLQHLKEGKSEEVAQLKALIANSKDSQHRNKYSGHLAKAKQWLELDQQELRRMEKTRSEFIRLSLENYMLSLAASDEHNNDALRFTALWLERSEEESTNETVKKHISKVPTRKFASLMNQLSSRLLDQNNLFQKLLIDLVFRICIDHPYHGMYHVWSGARTKVNKEDEVAVSRQKATDRTSKALVKNERVSGIWLAIDSTSRVYHALAMDRDPARYKQGQRLALKDSPVGSSFIKAFGKYHIPPPTMQLELSAIPDYSNVPIIQQFEPEMTIAGGVSAPKIITALASDGKRYKQLVKGGNDDLRQDAIMEQVFAAVSELLKLHRTTRQRNLVIRTYKVLPLTAMSGLIEFVSDTIPLHEYLMPAHERYYPKDLKGSHCRKEISAAQTKSVDARVNAYRKVTEKFHPVMRYFFMERFPDPDEWFMRRTAYTRSTAAISILGHVLGVGDRHGHNILLDSITGEVVHIDLGVAFEMGRVLPVPELVPFRLTRDIVDGMGITKTEGVFRRCCEFTLDALREETYSIMTILDVLRYDPLYSWSISPVRMAKLQNARAAPDGTGDDVSGNGGDDQTDVENKRTANEPSEADRALEVVRKKLSKTLSVMATVNDLINQATDERNLAVLYSGWAAYA